MKLDFNFKNYTNALCTREKQSNISSSCSDVAEEITLLTIKSQKSALLVASWTVKKTISGLTVKTETSPSPSMRDEFEGIY